MNKGTKLISASHTVSVPINQSVVRNHNIFPVMMLASARAPCSCSLSPPRCPPLRARGRARSVTTHASSVPVRRAILLGSAGAALGAGLAVPGSPISSGPALAAAAPKVDVGDVAPTFALPKAGGGKLALADALKESKFVVLYFYNQDFSPGCSVEAQRFQQSLTKFESKGAKIVGISMDPIDKHEEFCDKGGLTFPVLSDADGSVSAQYGAELSIPLLGKFSDRQTFLIDSAGTVKGHWLERDGSMANVKTTEHADQVLAKIDQVA